jgi:hypothetical protein
MLQADCALLQAQYGQSIPYFVLYTITGISFTHKYIFIHHKLVQKQIKQKAHITKQQRMHKRYSPHAKSGYEPISLNRVEVTLRTEAST